MNTPYLEKKYVHLISRIKILNQEVELVEQIATDAALCFQESFHSQKGVKNLKEPPQKNNKEPEEDIATSEDKQQEHTPPPKEQESPPPTEEPEDSTSEEESVSPERVKIDSSKKQKNQELKKMFRNIARETHPDRISKLPLKEKFKKEELFSEAQKSFEENDFYGLIIILNKLKLSLPPISREKINLLKESVRSKENLINEKKQTFAWVWYHADSEEEKDQIMKRYIITLREMQNDPWSGCFN